MWRPDRHDGRLTGDQERELEALDRLLAGGGAATAAEAELAGLLLAVRDDRPPVRPAFADALDARVAAGFPRGPAASPAADDSPARKAASPRVRRRPQTRHWLAGLGAVATLAAAVAVVSGAGPATDSSVQGPAGTAQSAAPTAGAGDRKRAAPAAAAAAAPPTAAVPVAPGAGLSGSAGAGAPLPVPVPVPGPGSTTTTGGARAVARDATLGLVAPRGQVQAVTDRAIAATDRLGGLVVSSQVALDDQGSSQASLELQVPSAALDRTLATLSALAHVGSRTQNALDITDATGAARDRLAQARAERQALLRQLARATTANALASIRAQLALVGGRIASDQAQLGSLLARGQFAHLSVTVTEGQQSAGAGGAGSGWGPGAALDDALSVLEAVFAVLVIALAGFVPVAVLGALAWWGTRPLRRRRREAALGS